LAAGQIIPRALAYSSITSALVMTKFSDRTNPGSDLPDWLRGVAPACVEGCDQEVFRIARRSYDSPWRFYHTWSHIAACLAQFAKQKFDNPRTVLLALLYHDAVYVPGSKDNETRSAELAERMLRYRSSVPEIERRAISRMILLTANHHSAAHRLTPDEAKLIDIDLSILGQTWPVYQDYMRGVRREFCPAVTSDFRYRIGRRAFLEGVLRQRRIFVTDEMANRLEATARSNISKEIDLLKAEAGVFGGVVARLLSRH
jgi:predicted metal-dependent HD superfamily phosphohydrolase